MKLQELADQLGATLTGGNPQTEITGVAGIETAGPGEVTFVANPKYAALARSTRAAAILVEPTFADTPVPTLRVANPYLAFARAIECFYQPPTYNVTLGDDAILLPHVVLYPGASIGDRFFAHAHAVVREHCRLGDDVILQNGAIIGADGFGFAKGPGGRWVKIVQSGPTILEDAVEVQANACIDRASIGETRIAAGAKIDNLVQVGHGSTVGENTLLCAQVGLAGSTTIGRNVILAGQVGVAGHLTVGDGAIATAQTGIPSDVAPGAVVSGYPAMDNRAWLRTVAAINRLPDLLRKLRGMDK
jgi:UDP-3-O-[3-hydroxymyristoyl] glucosamine N-acyltransferase